MSARLLKVLMQPVYVAEQDGEMVEVTVQPPITMSAKQWRDLDPRAWAKEVAVTVDDHLTAAALREAPGQDVGHKVSP